MRSRTHSFPYHVASRRDAWIETCILHSAASFRMSHPAGMRGLKLCYSHLRSQGQVVASRRDAWIETMCVSTTCTMKKVASRRDAWIETYTLLVVEQV